MSLPSSSFSMKVCRFCSLSLSFMAGCSRVGLTFSGEFRPPLLLLLTSSVPLKMTLGRMKTCMRSKMRRSAPSMMRKTKNQRVRSPSLTRS